MSYSAPLEEIQFQLFDVFNVHQLYSQMPGYEPVNQELIGTIIDEMGKFASGVFQPTNRPGDEQGCTYHAEDRSVSVPASFHDAYRQYVESGWGTLSAPEAYGGQGLPHLFSVIFDEMGSATNPALGMYFGLTHGAVVALQNHGSEELKNRYLAKLISAEWTGTMCLTEPQCGTDLGLIKTKAEPGQAADSFVLNGAKIWISGGEQDLSENIIHLVLARLPDAPAGTRGISLFLVPKILPSGERNGIYCTGLEHKMGINGSATCFMSLENAEGYLIGEPNRGLECMFSMMNTARIQVGVQGLGLADAAYQVALSFARERDQGRSLSGAAQPEKPADNILVHPDVRRMLLKQKVMIEAGRAMAYWTGINLDIASHHPDSEKRQRAGDIVDFMTPIIKAFLTDQGYQACDTAVQTLGGSGYTKDWHVEQFLRDCRIARIYEGTNGIQALDLVGRKFQMHGGRLVQTIMEELYTIANQCGDDKTQATLLNQLKLVTEAISWLQSNAIQDPEQAAAVATPLLELMGFVIGAFMLAKAAHAAEQKQAEGDSRLLLATKGKSRDYYFAEYLPNCERLLQTIKQGKQHLMAFDEAEF